MIHGPFQTKGDISRSSILAQPGVLGEDYLKPLLLLGPWGEGLMETGKPTCWDGGRESGEIFVMIFRGI